MTKGRKVLLIDDEIDSLLQFFVRKVEYAGFRVIKVETFADAVRWLESEKEEVCGVILDIIMPLALEEHDAYFQVTGYKPRGVEDAMLAGAALIPVIQSSLPGVPLFILTNVPLETQIGNRARAIIDPLIDDGTVKGLWRKPAGQSFFAALANAVDKPKD